MMEATSETKKKNYYGAKLYRQSFEGQDLSHADFRCASLIECNFNNADLSYANFEAANCRDAKFIGTKLYRANFKDAALAGSAFEPKDAFGMTITLSCETVDGMKVGKLWWFIWIMLALRMQIPEGEETAELKIIDAIGKERYIGLRQLFERRIM
jgi:hypothetical protein